MNEKSLIERADRCYKRLKLPGVKEAIANLLDDPENSKRSPLEWIVEALEYECDRRDTNLLKDRLRKAKLRFSMAEEGAIIYREERNLNKSQIELLATCEWIKRHQNCLITGKVGTDKTFIAECLAVAACRMGFSARVARLPLLLQEVSSSRQISGEYRNEIRALKKVQLLVLDDWGLGPLDSLSRGDLLEIIEARHESASTIVTSVLPVSSWANWIGDPTYADAILDRLTAGPVRIELKGESMRSKQS